MERFAMQSLISWKQKQDRKPLLIRGARQVGKTWLMKEFGKNEFASTAYVNFENSKFESTPKSQFCSILTLESTGIQ